MPMGLKVGGSTTDVREINTVAELDRYVSDFGSYNVALDLTDADQPEILIHRTPAELSEALRRLLLTGSSLINPSGDTKPGKHTLYLHSYSPHEASRIITDEEYAQIQFDIMKFRATVLGLMPDSRAKQHSLNEPAAHPSSPHPIEQHPQIPNSRASTSKPAEASSTKGSSPRGARSSKKSSKRSAR